MNTNQDPCGCENLQTNASTVLVPGSPQALRGKVLLNICNLIRDRQYDEP